MAPSTDGGDAPDADTVSLDTSTLTPGAHQLKLVVTDKAGNRRQSDWVHTFNPTAVGLPPEDQADDPGSSEDGVSDSGHGCQLQPAPAPLDLASSLGALPDQPPTNSTAAANDFTALNAMAADAGIVIDEDAHPTVALTDEGRALTAINQAVASGEAAPVEASAGPEATIAVGVGLSQTCISTPQMQAASSFAKLAPDSALLALGSTGAVAVQSVQDSVNLAYWVPASIAAAGLQIKLDLHDGQSLVQDGDNVAVKANPDLNADMEQLDEGQLPPDSGAPVPPDSPDPAAMGDDSPGQDPGTYTSDTPEGGLTLGEEDAYLRPVSATVNGQPVRLTLTVTGPDTIIAAVAQSHATGQVQMKISAHAAKGRPPRPEQPPQWNGKTSPCGRSNPCGGGLNIAKALAYTRKYVNSNNRYYTINDAYDCTNFISQILWAGGMRLRRAYTSGADSWWFWRAKKGWVKREEHTKSWVRFDSLRDQLLHLGLGRRVPIDKVQPGDLVFYDFGGGDGHAVIVTETKDGNAKFCYHSTNICRWRRPFKGDTSAERERRFEVIQAYDHRVAIRIRAVQANIHQEH